MASHATTRAYLGVFAALAVLTVLEVAAVKTGLPKRTLVLLLVSLAVTKAVLVALFFMHLRWETRVLRWMVAVPLATPAVYGVVLIAATIAKRMPA